MVGDMVGKS